MYTLYLHVIYFRVQFNTQVSFKLVCTKMCTRYSGFEMRNKIYWPTVTILVLLKENDEYFLYFQYVSAYC